MEKHIHKWETVAAYEIRHFINLLFGSRHVGTKLIQACECGETREKIINP